MVVRSIHLLAYEKRHYDRTNNDDEVPPPFAPPARFGIGLAELPDELAERSAEEQISRHETPKGPIPWMKVPAHESRLEDIGDRVEPHRGEDPRKCSSGPRAADEPFQEGRQSDTVRVAHDYSKL